MLDFNLLLVVDRLAREGSVSHAARALGTSPSTVSKALGRLRAHFDDQLFASMPGGMVPTPFIEALLPRVRELVREAEELAAVRSGFDPARSTRSFRILCSDYTYTALVTRAIRQLRIEAPLLSICCMLTSEQSPELMRNGEVDLAIVPRERLIDDHPAERLFEDDFSCVIWTGNSVIGETLSLDQFLAADHVSTMLGPRGVPHLQDEAFERHNIKPKIAVYSPNFTSVAETVVGTDLIATMHSRSARLALERLPLRVLPPPLKFRPFTEMLQWHRRSTEDAGTIWLRNKLCEIAAQLE